MNQHQRRGAAVAPLLLALAMFPQAAASQVVMRDTTPLSLYDVPAGPSLDPLAHRIRTMGGRPLRCVGSRQDRSVQDCRGRFTDSVTGNAVELWLSAIDSVAGIVTFTHAGSVTQLERWRHDLERRYGAVPTQVQGPQRMMQWVRRGRMIRLTWRREQGGTTASVSLVDGRVLDGWGAQRRPRTP